MNVQFIAYVRCVHMHACVYVCLCVCGGGEGGQGSVKCTYLASQDVPPSVSFCRLSWFACLC